MSETKIGSTDRLIQLIRELRQSPATVFELSAAVGVRTETARLNVRKLRNAGMVEFDSFDTRGGHGRDGQKAAKWRWKA